MLSHTHHPFQHHLPARAEPAFDSDACRSAIYEKVAKTRYPGPITTAVTPGRLRSPSSPSRCKPFFLPVRRRPKLYFAPRFSLLPEPYHRYRPHRYQHHQVVESLAIAEHNHHPLAGMLVTLGRNRRRPVHHRCCLLWPIPVEGDLAKLVGTWALPPPKMEETRLAMQGDIAVVEDDEDLEE